MAIRSPSQPAAPLPATTVILQATRRVQALHATELPRMLELAQALRAEAATWCVAGLLFVLHAHLAAARALRFDLLVPTGLRGTPPRHGEATFRLQVEEVSTCTEVTWAQVRIAGAAETHQDSMPAAVVDFVMGSRPLQRAVGGALEGLAAARSHVIGREAQLGEAAAILLPRLDEADRQMQQVAAACTGAQAVQRAAYRTVDANSELVSALQELGQIVRGGLLVRLAALVASDILAPADELQQATIAREQLRTALESAIGRAEEMRAVHEGLLETLDGMVPEPALA